MTAPCSIGSVMFRCTVHGDYDADYWGGGCPACLLVSAAQGRSPILLAPAQISWIVSQLQKLKEHEELSRVDGFPGSAHGDLPRKPQRGDS